MITIENGQAMLADLFAPWVQALGLRVTAVEVDAATLVLPFDPKLARIGGTVCGQALMAAADTAMVIAIASQLGGMRPMTTVTLTTHFMRPVADSDVEVTARVLKPGRTTVFGEIRMTSLSDGRLAAHATTTYALL